LSYEQAQTRHVPRRKGWYNLNTHFPWIGFRTRAIDGAHVEYFRGIVNPVGIKVGPGMEAEELIRLIETLNPENEKGKITLIHRFGADQIANLLEPLIAGVKNSELDVLWTCDPMHGNTYSTNTGIKTRNFDQIISELKQAFKIHRANDSILGGVHLEMTGDDVTECVGGAGKLAEPDLHRAYKSAVDPRLNYDQAIELAFTIAEHMKSGDD
jgi:3-deoxy-7-phosphoheptulonate synthase